MWPTLLFTNPVLLCMTPGLFPQSTCVPAAAPFMKWLATYNDILVPSRVPILVDTILRLDVVIPFADIHNARQCIEFERPVASHFARLTPRLPMLSPVASEVPWPIAMLSIVVLSAFMNAVVVFDSEMVCSVPQQIAILACLGWCELGPLSTCRAPLPILVWNPAAQEFPALHMTPGVLALGIWMNPMLRLVLIVIVLKAGSYLPCLLVFVVFALRVQFDVVKISTIVSRTTPPTSPGPNMLSTHETTVNSGPLPGTRPASPSFKMIPWIARVKTSNVSVGLGKIH